MSIRTRAAGEEGFALVGVLLALLVMTGLAVLFQVAAVAEIRVTDRQRAQVSALPAAEAGAELVAARVIENRAVVTAGPGGAQHQLTGGLSDAQQRQWAIDQYYLAKASGGVTAVPGGTTYGLRPVVAATTTPADVIFGVGEVNDVLRVVRMDITPAAFTPPRAVSTHLDLNVRDTAVVRGSVGGVHANRDLVLGSLSDAAPGTATRTRTCLSLAVCQPTPGSGLPEVALPDLRARQYYDAYALATPGWYDLCPDGRFRRPSASGPCLGVIIATPPVWSWTASSRTWLTAFTANISGVYYAHEASITLGDTSGGTATLLASRGASTLGSVGNIRAGAASSLSPVLGDLALLADRDLVLGPTSGVGCRTRPQALVAGEQFLIDDVVAVCGAVVGLDNRYWGGPANTPGSPVAASRIGMAADVRYDGALKIPQAQGLLRLTNWKEL